jgi:hypothetical protein
VWSLHEEALRISTIHDVMSSSRRERVAPRIAVAWIRWIFEAAHPMVARHWPALEKALTGGR